MPDLGGAVKQISQEVVQDIVKPRSNEVGQDLEQGAQSIFGTQTKPASNTTRPVVDPQKQADEEARKRAAWEKVQKWNTDLQNAQAKVRADIQKQEEERRQFAEEKDKIEQYKVIESQQTQNDLASQVKEAQTKSETRKGVGG